MRRIGRGRVKGDAAYQYSLPVIWRRAQLVAACETHAFDALPRELGLISRGSRLASPSGASGDGAGCGGASCHCLS